MKKTIFGAALSLFASVAFAQTDVSVVEAGDGYRQILVKNPAVRKELIAEVQTSYPTAYSTYANTSNEPTNVLVFETLRAVLNADIPDWLQEEILQEQTGFTSWGSVSHAQLDAELDQTVSINLDAIGLIGEKAESTGDPGVYGQYGVCKKYKRAWHKSFPKSVTKNESLQKNYTKTTANAAVNADLNGYYKAELDLALNVEAFKKKRCGFTYGVEFHQATASAKGKLDGKLELSGDAQYKLTQQLLKAEFDLWSHTERFWVSIAQFKLDLDLEAELGATLDVDAHANFSGYYKVDGMIDMFYRCASGKSCEKERDDTSFSFENPGKNAEYEFELSVIITPYAESRFNARLRLYEDIALIKATLGVRAALPITFYAYFGNMCSDANGDGINERVASSYLDVTAELSAYISYRLGKGSTKTTYFYLPIDSWGRAEYDGKKVVRKNFYFNDFSREHSVFDPVVTASSKFSETQDVTIGTRKCFRLVDTPKFEVSWGDGSSNYIGDGKTITHTWPGLNYYVLKARMIGDSSGRTIDGNWVEVGISSISVQEDVSAPVTASKTQFPGPHSFYEVRMKTPTPTVNTQFELWRKESCGNLVKIYAGGEDRDELPVFISTRGVSVANAVQRQHAVRRCNGSQCGEFTYF